MINAQVLEDARKLISGGADTEVVLVFLRENGLDKIDSINSIRALFAKSMPEAKTLVDNSRAWSDHFYSDQDLHDKARRAVSELAASEDKTLPRIELVGLNDEIEEI